MILTSDLTKGQFRLLEVDNRLVLPTGINIKFLITSTDVLHSYAVPSLGIKLDAAPGRLNQVFVTIIRTGVYYGQCSELCGINHGFMPIVIEAVRVPAFLNYVEENHLGLYYDNIFFEVKHKVANPLSKDHLRKLGYPIPKELDLDQKPEPSFFKE